jgi:hypothetical protein
MTDETEQLKQLKRSNAELTESQKRMTEEIMTLRAQLDDARRESEWQPMSLSPAPEVPFLINHKEFGPMQAKWSMVNLWNGDGTKILNKEFRICIRSMTDWPSTTSDKFTGWQPLPQPPKEKADA